MGRRKRAVRSLRARTLGMESSVRRPSKHVLARLREWEQTHRGDVAAIETESEEIFLGKDVVGATLKGWKKYPGRPFYFVRIGYPAVHRRVIVGPRSRAAGHGVKAASNGSRER